MRQFQIGAKLSATLLTADDNIRTYMAWNRVTGGYKNVDECF